MGLTAKVVQSIEIENHTWCLSKDPLSYSSKLQREKSPNV